MKNKYQKCFLVPDFTEVRFDNYTAAIAFETQPEEESIEMIDIKAVQELQDQINELKSVLEYYKYQYHPDIGGVFAKEILEKYK